MATGCPCCESPWEFYRFPTAWTHMKLSISGTPTVQWVADHGASLADIVYSATDSALYINSYLTASAIDNAQLRRLALTSDIVWSLDLAASASDTSAICVTSNGDIITGPYIGAFSSGLRRSDSSGTTLWTTTVTETLIDAARDASDNIYIAKPSSIGKTEAYDSSGTLLWSTGHGSGSASNTNVCTDSTLVCSAGARGSGSNIYTTYVFDMSGALQWRADNLATVNASAWMPNGNLVTVGNRASDSKTTRCYNSSGTLQWSVDHGSAVNAVAVDSSNNVYTGGTWNNITGSILGGYTTRKYNSSGTLQWSHNYGLGQVSGVAVNGLCLDGAGNLYAAGTRLFL